MSTTVKLKPISTLRIDLGLQNKGPVHAYFTKKCDEHMDKYVPFREGLLAYDDKKVKVDKIIYEAPHAHYMYEGKVMGPNIPIKENGIIVKWVSPKNKPKYYTGRDIKYNKTAGHEYAGPHWDKRMWSAEKDEIIKEVQKFVDRGGK